MVTPAGAGRDLWLCSGRAADWAGGPLKEQGGHDLGFLFVGGGVGAAAEYQPGHPVAHVRREQAREVTVHTGAAMVTEQHVRDLMQHDVGSVKRAESFRVIDVVGICRAHP